MVQLQEWLLSIHSVMLLGMVTVLAWRSEAILELQVSDKQLTIPKVPPRTPFSKQNLKKDNS